MRLPVTLLVGMLLSGCAITHLEVGTWLPPIHELEVGATTREQALALLGPPRLVRRQFDGELYTWRILRGETRSIAILPVFVRLFFWQESQLLRDDVALLFDRSGVLRAVGVRRESQDP